MNYQCFLKHQQASVQHSITGLSRKTPKGYKPWLSAIVVLLALFACQEYAQASMFWSGPNISFTKANNADWTLAVNQDRITDNVWLTRANAQGLFNIAPGKEIAFQSLVSPLDTEWSFGSIAGGVQTLVFKDWQSAVKSNPQSSLSRDMVLHLKSDDIYIDLKFLSFQGSNGGGGFSYLRSTAPEAVPLPGSIWLFGSALLGFIGKIRRKASI
jgi:hypothetical protein